MFVSSAMSAALAAGLLLALVVPSAAVDNTTQAQARKVRFLNDRIDWWKKAGYPQVQHEGKEWKLDEIEPCWAGAHAALVLKRNPEEIERANRFFETAPIDWDCDPDMRICELLHSYYTFRNDRDFSDAAKKHLLSIFDTKEPPRRLNASIWRFGATENHAMMGHVWRLLVSQLRNDDPEVSAVGRHIEEYILEHARKGWQEYYSPCYAEKEIGCMVMLREWAKDEKLRKLANLMLDMIFAEQAALDLDGMMCGPCARAYGADPIPDDNEVNHNSRRDRMRSGNYSAAYIVFGDAKPHFYGVLGSMCLASSSYTLPDVISRLALAREERGSYEFRARKPGKGLSRYRGSDEVHPGDEVFNTRVYCYVTPDYVLGTSQEAGGKYGMTQGGGNALPTALVVRGSTRKTIFFDCDPEDQDLFQYKNVVVGRNPGGDAYVATDELGKPIEKNGWTFFRDENAFIAFRPARGGYKWRKIKSEYIFGDYLDFTDKTSPFILEVARPSDYDGDFERFTSDIMDNKYKVNADGGLVYESCSGGSSGPSAEKFQLELRPGELPKVDGKVVDLESYPTIASPYVNSKWNSGVVTISYGGEKLALDFNNP